LWAHRRRASFGDPSLDVLGRRKSGAAGAAAYRRTCPGRKSKDAGHTDGVITGNGLDGNRWKGILGNLGVPLRLIRSYDSRNFREGKWGRNYGEEGRGDPHSALNKPSGVLNRSVQKTNASGERTGASIGWGCFRSSMGGGGGVCVVVEYRGKDGQKN